MVSTASSPRCHSSDTGRRYGAGARRTGGFGMGEWPTVDIHGELWRTAHITHWHLPSQRRQKQMTSCDHLLTLFLVRADAATSKTSDIFEVTLCYHLHFSVWPRLPVSHLHPVEVLTCICVSVSFGTQFAIKVRKRLKFFTFFFSVVHFVPQENVISSLSRSQWQNNAALSTQSNDQTCSFSNIASGWRKKQK